MTSVSVIVPVYNGGEDLRLCLAALSRSTRRPEEVIVVDDASRDNSARDAARSGARVVSTSGGPLGPGKARNRGADAAEGDLLLFVDADVEVHADAVDTVVRFFDENPRAGACFGCYDTEPSAPNFVSQYKNLFHHYTHRISVGEAYTFWAGCGAVRRSAFRELDGFDDRYMRPMIEDIELGGRLRDAGYDIRLLGGLLCTHRKRWTLASMIRSDVRDRALPWTRLILDRMSIPRALNVRADARASSLLAWLAVLSGVVALRFPWAWVPAVVALVALIVFNRRFYAFLARERGPWFAVRAVPLHFAYFIYASATFAVALATYPRYRRSGRRVPARPPIAL